MPQNIFLSVTKDKTMTEDIFYKFLVPEMAQNLPKMALNSQYWQNKAVTYKVLPQKYSLQS